LISDQALSFIREDRTVGKPFSYGGRGPDRFDCYGLVLYLYKNINGLDVTDYKTPEGAKEIMSLMHSEIPLVFEESEPHLGAMIYMRMARSSHVAYDLGDGRFIHVWENSGGVRIERADIWHKNIINYYKPKF